MSCSPSSGRSASVWVSSPASSRSTAGSLGGEHRRALGRGEPRAERQQRPRRASSARGAGRPARGAACMRQRGGRAAPHAVRGEPPRDPGRLRLELRVGDARTPSATSARPVGAALRSLGEPVVELHRTSPGVYALRASMPTTPQGRPARGGALRADRVAARPASTRTSSTSTADGIAKITINRPEVRNAFRPPDPGRAARRVQPGPRRHSRSARSSSPARATEAFCSGGDQRIRGDDGYIGDDEVAEQGVGRLDVGDLHVQIRRLPKPVVADGRRLRDRRRPHPPPRLRPDDRRRQRPLRPDRPAGRQLRRRLRRRPARPRRSGPRRRRRSGSSAASTTPRRRSRWASSTRSSRSTDLERETVAWCREMLAPLPLALRLLKASFNAARGRAHRAPAALPRRDPALLHERGGPGGPQRLPARSRQPDFSQVPRSGLERLADLADGGAAADAAGGDRAGAGRHAPRRSQRAGELLALGRLHRRAGRLDLHPDRDQPRQRLLRRQARRRHRRPARPGARHLGRAGHAAAGAVRDLGRVRDRRRLPGIYLATVAGLGDPRSSAPPRSPPASSTPAARVPTATPASARSSSSSSSASSPSTAPTTCSSSELDWLPFGLSIPVGCLATAILVVNNIRDIDTDRRAGKRTLAVRIGRERTRAASTSALVGGAYRRSCRSRWSPATAPGGRCSACSRRRSRSRPLAAVLTRTDGPALNGALAGTGALLGVFSLLVSRRPADRRLSSAARCALAEIEVIPYALPFREPYVTARGRARARARWCLRPAPRRGRLDRPRRGGAAVAARRRRPRRGSRARSARRCWPRRCSTATVDPSRIWSAIARCRSRRRARRRRWRRSTSRCSTWPAAPRGEPVWRCSARPDGDAGRLQRDPRRRRPGRRSPPTPSAGRPTASAPSS